MENIIKLQDEIFKFLCTEKPVNATYLGIKGYDTSLGNFSDENLKKLDLEREKFINRLEDINASDLALNLSIDSEILKNALECDLEINKRDKPLYRNANIYLENCLMGIYFLILRNSERHQENTLAITERLKQIPSMLNFAKQNLLKGENIPKLWTEMAIEMAEGGITFLSHIIEENNFGLLPDSLKVETEKNKVFAIQALKDFEEFLKKELLPISNGSFSLGEELFDLMVNKIYHLKYSISEILEIGNDLFDETELLLKETAKTISPAKDWKQIIAEESKNYINHNELMSFYKQELQRAKQFLKDNDLITIPEDDILDIVETPEFERDRIPFAAYIPPSPFGNEKKGFFWVTPGEEGKPGQNRFMGTLVSAHEGFPGHHLQYIITNNNPSKVRKFLSDDSLVEGWALYWEENMYLSGYCKDEPMLRLFQLRNKLWRCCRVMIDVSLHTGKMTFDEAVNMLVEKVDLEKQNAIGEVKRYTMMPTQPMSYIIGIYEILKLKADLKNQMRNDFSQKFFHDSLLKCGPISLPLIRKILL